MNYQHEALHEEQRHQLLLHKLLSVAVAKQAVLAEWIMNSLGFFPRFSQYKQKAFSSLACQVAKTDGGEVTSNAFTLDKIHKPRMSKVSKKRVSFV